MHQIKWICLVMYSRLLQEAAKRICLPPTGGFPVCLTGNWILRILHLTDFAFWMTGEDRVAESSAL